MPVETWFPTVIYYEDLEVPPAVHEAALNAARQVIDEERLSEIKRYTAADAPNTFHHNEAIQPLLALIQPHILHYVGEVLRLDTDTIDFYMGRCWPVIQTGDGAGRLHCHLGATVSGVFYLDIPEGAGPLQFERPARSSYDHLKKTEDNELNFEYVEYAAIKHRLILFASSLLHRALANTEGTEGPRIAIAFDVYAMSSVENRGGGLPQLDNFVPLS